MRSITLALAVSFSVLCPLAASALPLDAGELVVLGTSSLGSGLSRIDDANGAQSFIASGTFQDFAVFDRQTIYAIELGTVVRINVSTGAKTSVSSGGQLVAPSGIAVDPIGNIQVLDLESAGGAGAVLQIDPTTGSQTVVTSGGLMVEGHRRSDLEMSPTGDLIVLDSVGTLGLGEVFAVDIASGLQTLLYSDPVDSPAPFEFLFEGTGLGIAANGDIYVSNGTAHSTGVLMIDAGTGEAVDVGHIVACCYLDDEGNPRGADLLNTDMAIAEDGSAWMVGSGIGGNGLWRWDGAPMFEDGEVPFSVGNFEEVQVVSSTLPIPEPSTALLVGLGLIALGVFRRNLRAHLV